MLHRFTEISIPRGGDPQDDSVVRLLASLQEGVIALRDPEIEAKVRDYFERHPNYSCDLIHVAAVACGFQAAKQRATISAQSSQTATTISRRI